LIGFRPKPSALFLERPRLLSILPEEPGYIVWLEAPYGYGKSVLVSQWAAQLERDAWRVIWLALVDGDPRRPLAMALGLSENAAWSLVLEGLALEKTLVILEDLENDPEAGASLGPLLKHNPGLVLLASRKGLHTPELPRARTEGRLIHLRAEHLAFTQDEAAILFGDQDSSLAWDRTRGWSLPLHMAALTGEMPDEESLWEGVRESLEPKVWEEVLLLSALPYLPSEFADDRAEHLARLGFVQELEKGFRLHPLAAETVFKRHTSAVQKTVWANLERLPLALQAEACARSDLLPELETMLEDYSLAVEDSVGVLRWDALCKLRNPLESSPARLLTLSWAYSVTNQHEMAMQTYFAVAHHLEATPPQRLNALGWALFDLRPGEFDQADALLEQAKPWLKDAEPIVRGAFLINAATFYMEMHCWQEAEPLLEQGVPILSPENRLAGRINLALVRWELRGDVLGYLEELRSSLEVPGNRPFNNCTSLEWLGRIDAMLGQADRALESFDLLETLREHSPKVAFLGRVQAAALRFGLGKASLEVFTALEREALTFANPETGEEPELGFVRAHLVQCLRESGQIQQAHKLLEATIQKLDTPRLRIEYALILHALGQSSQALEWLEPVLGSSFRQNVVLAQAAKYRITKNADDLERLLNLTNAGNQILPALVPLLELPRDRADLCKAYPLGEVLLAGWREAAQVRHAEIPALEVKLLGGFAVRLLGQPVTLTGRPRDILIMLALGLPREQIAETLWPDADGEKSRNNLHVNLNIMRKVLEPWGLPTYILESGLSRTHVDLNNLEVAVTRQDIATIRNLYAKLAPGIDLAPLEEAREHWHERILETLLEHVRNHADNEATLELILELDPLHEEACSLLLSHLIRTGRRITAQRRYRDFSRRLQDTLGLEPTPELQHLVMR
jgi:DNA-binding SARP family transcriptional activator